MKIKSKTWYLDNSDLIKTNPKLSENACCDILVVGGGLAGLSLCYELNSRGLQCLLIDSGEIGDNASGCNGGFCSPGWSADRSALQKMFGKKITKQFNDLSREGFDWMRNRLKMPEFAKAKLGRLFHHHKQFD